MYNEISSPAFLTQDLALRLKNAIIFTFKSFREIKWFSVEHACVHKNVTKTRGKSERWRAHKEVLIYYSGNFLVGLNLKKLWKLWRQICEPHAEPAGRESHRFPGQWSLRWVKENMRLLCKWLLKAHKQRHSGHPHTPLICLGDRKTSNQQRCQPSKVSRLTRGHWGWAPRGSM